MHNAPSIPQPSALTSLPSRLWRPTALWRTLGALLLVLSMVHLAADPADAKRMGGGKSFGSRSSQSGSYTKPVPPAGSTVTRDASKPSDAPGQTGAAGAARPASRFGGLGGMLGGLLMGGLLGSLFFGGGFGGFGLLEMLVLVVGGVMLFRFLRSRQTGPATQRPAASRDRMAYAAASASTERPSRADDGWAGLRSTPASGPVAAPAAPAAASSLPDGVDEADFLAGVKALYVRLQGSWDRRDLADIKSFTTPEVYAEIARQAQEDPTPGVTDLVLVEARVIETQREGSHTIVSVLFDVLLREDAAAERPDQVREVWHIRRDEAAAHPEWTLEGIQQLAV